MKRSYFSLLMLAIVVICTSCAREPQPMAYITNTSDVAITLYGDREKDSVVLSPWQRTYICDVDVIDGKFAGSSGHNWMFSVFTPVTKIKRLDTMYEVPEQYQKFLSDINNYIHHTSLGSSSSSPVKLEGSHYDYYLTDEFIEEIIQASKETYTLE